MYLIMRRTILLLTLALFSLTALCEQRSIISQIEPQNRREERILRHYNRDYRFGKRGYSGIVKVGAQAGDIGSYNVDVINGFSFNPWVAVGAGTGLYWNNGYGAIIPLYANVRVNILDRRVTPYGALSLGAMFHTYQSEFHPRISLLTELSIGVAVRLREGKSISFGIGNGGNFEEGSFKFSFGFVW